MPYVNVWIETDDLVDDIADEELVEELEGRGYSCFKNQAISGDFAIVEHLSVCGLIAEARAEALKIVGNAIGRRL